MKTILKIAFAISLVFTGVSCDKGANKPVLSGGYESAKVYVTITHVSSGSGGGGAIDTDQGMSDRELWGKGSASGKTTEHYWVKDVTEVGYNLKYMIKIENPVGSVPLPFEGSIPVPYNKPVTESITQDVTLTVETRKP
jgi:hypothetical protein